MSNSQVYDEVDRWEQEKDAAAMAIVGKGRGNRGNKKETREEVLALSGTDSDDDEGGAGDRDEEEKGGWGSRKKHYYGGNTGEEMEEDVGESDLEEDRAEEVEASKLQKRQLDDMEEEDFLDTFSLPVRQNKADQEKEKIDDTAPTVTRDLSQLSRKEQVALFKQKAPEFEGVVADFQLNCK